MSSAAFMARAQLAVAPQGDRSSLTGSRDRSHGRKAQEPPKGGMFQEPHPRIRHTRGKAVLWALQEALQNRAPNFFLAHQAQRVMIN